MDNKLKELLESGSGEKVSAYIQEHPDKLSGVHVANYKVVGVRLSDIKLNNVHFKDVDFSGSKFTNVTFIGGTFEGANFDDSELSNVKFIGVEFLPLDVGEYKLKKSSFNHSLFNEVSFTQRSKITDLELFHLKRGSSLIIENSDINSVIEGDGTLLFKSFLDSLIVKDSRINNVSVTIGVEGVKTASIINNHMVDSDFYGLQVQRLLIKGNKNSYLTATGKAEYVEISNNEDIEFDVGVETPLLVIKDNINTRPDEQGGYGLSGEVGDIIISGCDYTSITMIALNVDKLSFSNCNNLDDIYAGHSFIGEISSNNFDVNNFELFKTRIDNLHISNATIRKKTWVKEVDVKNFHVRNVTFLPEVDYKARPSTAEETKKFWNTALGKEVF